jgi:hypothetical protein
LKKILILPVITVLIFAILSHNAYATTLATTTALTSSLNPSTSVDPVTFTATISPAVPDTETVTFYDGTTVIGTGVTSGSVATFTTSLSVGSHQINATYAGDASFDPSTSSPAISQVVNAVVVPVTPTGVTATAISSSEITVSWTASSGATTYNIYSSTSSSGPFTLVGSTAATSFTNSGLSSSTTYYYEVSASNSAGTSASSPPVSASTQLGVGGTATKCTGLATCSFTLSSTTGNGWATTSAGVGGYVGQSPLLFSGISSFLLPGESIATYNVAYSGQAVLAGSSTTAGTLYHVTGTITGLDANDGTIVKGKTDTTVGIKGHSGRGGGIYFTLVSGTISFSKSTIRSSSTTVACNPSSISSGSTTTCTVTVTDPGVGTKITPTGTVTFAISNSYLLTSNSGSCTLSSGSCSVNFKSNQEYAPGTTSIYASYLGDSSHISSSGRTTVYVTSNGLDN